jgi:hypothetical protein
MMKTLTLENILEFRNWLVHAMIIIFSALVVVITKLPEKELFTTGDAISLFILLSIQMELFISIAVKIFRDVKPGHDRKDITRILLSRFVLFMVICFVVALVIVLTFVVIRSTMDGTDAVKDITGFFNLKFSGWVKGTLGGLLFGAAIFIYIQWQDALQSAQKLREENLIFQNETLKSQINPHFLFNSLNTMSSLISTRPDSAQLFISKLASIYRYIIENSPKDSVALETELEFIQDYFFLYRIRDEDKISLEIKVDKSAGLSILPVSLQSLVENAIKHNKATKEEPLMITVYLEDQYVVVRNNLQKMATQLKSTGTGLKNLSERSKLVTGKSILIEEKADSFTVKIPLLP